MWRAGSSFGRGVVLVGLVALVGACGDGGASFNVKHAPEFTTTGAKVSVFGIFKDGRMTPESWDAIGARLSRPFGKTTACEVAYGEKLVSSAPALSSAVDDYARANGVTDDLLDQFAPMAKGDAILLVTIAGHPPQPIAASELPKQAPAQSPRAMGGRRGSSQMSAPPRDQHPTDRSVFEVSATLFSVRLHRSVGVISMTYSGASVDEALDKFTERLTEELPGAACTDWNWDAHVDDEKIRKMMEQ
jgi:hypothetical protein